MIWKTLVLALSLSATSASAALAQEERAALKENPKEEKALLAHNGWYEPYPYLSNACQTWSTMCFTPSPQPVGSSCSCSVSYWNYWWGWQWTWEPGTIIP